MPAQGSRLHDRDLLDSLESFDPQPLSGTAWRVTWATRDPLAGNSAGGRWHPLNSFEALYTSLEADGALAEMYFHLSRAPVFASSRMRLHRLQVETARTLWLTDMSTLVRLGVDESRYQSLDHARSQEIGAAARFLEFDSLLVPSVRWPCQNLVLFLDRLDASRLTSCGEDATEVKWPAWRESRGIRH